MLGSALPDQGATFQPHIIILLIPDLNLSQKLSIMPGFFYRPSYPVAFITLKRFAAARRRKSPKNIKRVTNISIVLLLHVPVSNLSDLQLAIVLFWKGYAL